MRVPWLLGLVLAGCASSLPAAPASCLPPGVSPAFLSWPVAEAASRPHPVDGGDFALVSRVRYAAPGGGAVVGYWAQGSLFAVDPSPDTDSPPWLDLGRIMPDERTLRATPGEPCQWRRAGATRV